MRSSRMPLISIIVPVYNAEKYIRKCVDSILAQTFIDFELLLINDGSKDNSGAICDEYAAKDSRVCVFHKENGGVSSARNLGLDNVKGEWITFVDSDDYIESGYLNSMIACLDADLIMSSFKAIGSTEEWDYEIESRCYSKDEIKFFLDKYIWKAFFCTPWCKLFKLSLINSLRFDEKLTLAEDTIFVFAYLCKVESVRTVENWGYRYRRGINDSLSMRQYSLQQYMYIIQENSKGLKKIENRFSYNGEIVKIVRTAMIFRQALDVLRTVQMPFKKKYIEFVNLLTDKNVFEMLIYKNQNVKGIRRRFFDFLAIKRLYRLLFTYVLLYKGQLY